MIGIGCPWCAGKPGRRREFPVGGVRVRGVEVILLLVVLATGVAASARWLRVPAPSLLVLAGLLVAFVPGVPTIQGAPDVVGLAVLPPLLYAAGQDRSWRELRPVWAPVTVLALGLVLASAAAVSLVASVVTPLPGAMAFVLGAVLASTDPVAVTALGRRLSLPPRLAALIQAESLFNDATSLVLVRVAVGGAGGGGAVSLWRGPVPRRVLGGGGGATGGVGGGGGGLGPRVMRGSRDGAGDTLVTTLSES